MICQMIAYMPYICQTQVQAQYKCRHWKLSLIWGFYVFFILGFNISFWKMIHLFTTFSQINFPPKLFIAYCPRTLLNKVDIIINFYCFLCKISHFWCKFRFRPQFWLNEGNFLYSPSKFKIHIAHLISVRLVSSWSKIKHNKLSYYILFKLLFYHIWRR